MGLEIWVRCWLAEGRRYRISRLELKGILIIFEKHPILSRQLLVHLPLTNLWNHTTLGGTQNKADNLKGCNLFMELVQYTRQVLRIQIRSVSCHWHISGSDH